MPMPPPSIPNLFDDDDARRTDRINAQIDTDSRRNWVIFAAGIAVLVAWGVLVFLGEPGTGVMLVPIGVGMMLLSGLQLLFSR